MRSRAARRAGIIKPADKTDWHGFFEALYLECKDVEVLSVPYAPALAELIEAVAVRMRRDIDTLLDFVCAHAILHYNIRERNDEGQIVATLDDYEQVRKYLGNAFTTTAADDVVTPADRENVAALRRVLEAKGLIQEIRAASVTEVARELNLDKSAVSRRLARTIEAGWIINAETKPGMPAKLTLGSPLPETADDLLPTVEQIQQLQTGAI